MKFIGITGGVGAGKSTVLAYLKENYKCHIALADDAAKSLMEPGEHLLRCAGRPAKSLSGL